MDIGQNKDANDMSMGSDEDVLTVNIRGSGFEVYVKTLSRNPQSRLYRVAEERSHVGITNATVPRFNRNPLVFHSVLDYYVTGELHLPDGVCGRLIKQELEFWGLAIRLVSPCCLLKVLNADVTIQEIKDIETRVKANAVGVTGGNETGHLTIRQRTWNLVDQTLRSSTARMYFVVNLLVILMSLVLIALQTVPEYRLLRSPGTNLTVLDPMSLFTWLRVTTPDYWLVVADLVVLAYLTVTVLVRLAACPNRRAFLADPLNSIEMVAIALQWFPCSLLLVPNPQTSRHVSVLIFILTIFKILRVFPLLRIVRHYRGMQIMWMALRASRRELMFLVVVLHIAALLFGYLLYLAELWSENSQVKGIPDTLWWAVITMTTVGYGDIVPSTAAGKIVGFACAVTGILLVALPVPIIASNFYVINQHMHIAELHHKLQAKVGGEEVGTPGTRSQQEGRKKEAQREMIEELVTGKKIVLETLEDEEKQYQNSQWVNRNEPQDTMCSPVS